VKELLIRFATGIVFIIVLIGSIIFSNYAFAILFLFFSIFGQLEFFRLMNKYNDIKLLRGYGLLAGAVVYTVMALISMGILDMGFLMISLLITILPLIILLKQKTPNPFASAAVSAFSILYVVVPFGCLNFLLNKGMQTGIWHAENLIGFFILMWTYDVFAYLIGTIIGQHKLSQNISPQKTWEGSVGSGIITLGASYVISTFYAQLHLHQWVAIALIIIVFGTLGDIAESMLKRGANVKDSGTLLPGHGGFLDRFDGVLFSAPVVLIYLSIIK